MKFSIVTAAYNAGATIGDTLRSVREQSWPDVEHIIIDGGSSDDTAALVAAGLRPGGQFVSERDDGIYDAMNRGIRRATGDVIALLNADDFYAGPDILHLVAKAFTEGGTDAVLGDVGYVRGGALDQIVRRYDSSQFRPSRLGWGWMPAHPAMFLTRKAYDQVGEYRTDYRIAADFEFVARAFGRHQLTYRHLPAILVHMRLGGVSTGGIGASLTIGREAVRACRENGIRSNSIMVASRYPRKVMEYLGR
jgi:glycosyltransferase involved in cell wall biosynthesis